MIWLCVALLVAASGVALWAYLGWRREAAARAEQAERAQEAEACLSSLLSDLPFGTARLDEAGRLQDANPVLSRSLKRAPNQLNGLALTDLTHLDDLKELNRDGAGKDNQWHGVEARLLRGDGVSIWSRLWRRDSLLMLENIGETRDLEREMKATRRAMDDLYHAVAAEHLPFEERLQSLLELGCRRFGLETGLVGQIEEDKIKVLSVVSPHDMMRRGDTLEAPGATVSIPARRARDPHYVAKTSENVATRVNGAARAGDWRDHPVHAASDSEAFLGAPIHVAGQLYGTLNFSSRMARPEGFSSDETQWVKLMAHWIGGEIEKREARATLEAKTGELEAANLRLEALATHDGLTGVKNRRAFNEQLEKEWARARRYGTPFSIVLLDVDNFKTFNDTFGHPAGDEVLKIVAGILQAGVRAIDFVARYGGEEFVILLPNTPAAGAMILAERLRTRIQDAEWTPRQVTISIGCSSITEEYESAAILTGRADKALYRSKEKGRNRSTHFRELGREAATPL